MLSLGLMVKELPADSIWSVGGIGESQLKMNAMGIVAGGGVRIGLEDNIYFDAERTMLASNADLIRRILSIAEAMGRTPYSHQEARKFVGI
jgi:3-keto-5-aminohexanoate cleavage enzyme